MDDALISSVCVSGSKEVDEEVVIRHPMCHVPRLAAFGVVHSLATCLIRRLAHFRASDFIEFLLDSIPILHWVHSHLPS